MKNKLKKNKLIVIGIVTGILITLTTAYAGSTIGEGKDIIYDNTKMGGTSDNVQGSIDELYKKVNKLSGIGDEIYTDSTLNGADPVLDKGMIPVTIEDNGEVKYANRYSKWYDYEEKEWANAVILVDSAKDKYKEGNTIDENDIESYFVWIPRYKYKIWNTGNYSSYYTFSNLTDTGSGDTSLRNITGNARIIEIVFENKDNTVPSEGTQVGQYLTHPAFQLGEKKLNGIWVGKFEVGGNESSVVVKPNVTSWRNETVGTFFKILYEYKRDLDSHMMKNTEWGAVAYLSHSIYGKGSEVNINNNSNFLTGYSAASNTDQTDFPGEVGATSPKTEKYNTPTGYLASTTGNISGIYDMSGGASEYMAAYKKGQNSSTSGLNEELTNYSIYFDEYPENSNEKSFNNRKLGDATGEMGPFYYYYDGDGVQRIHISWYGSLARFVDIDYPWFDRGGMYDNGVFASQFYFNRQMGEATWYLGSRLVLAPTK